MKCKLTKLSNNKNNLRTTVIEGVWMDPPMVGYHFYMVAKSLEDNKDARVIRTSKIIEVHRKNNIYTFKTENSEYKVEKFDEYI